MTALKEIRTLLEDFQEGYIHRDITQLDTFMEMFLPDVEVIGTPGLRQGVNEWYTDRDGARELMVIDFETWGDLRLDLPSASIHVNGNTGWMAIPATVTQIIGKEKYDTCIGSIKELIEETPLSSEQKLLSIIRSGSNMMYELNRGNKFIWPLRFTAVVVRQENGWKFAQMEFSFPTENLPGVRIFDDVKLDRG